MGPVVTNFLDAFLEAPLWARILVPILVFAALASAVDKPWRRRRARDAFARLARAVQQPVTTIDWVTETFPLEAGRRPFDVRREWHSRHSGGGVSSYRGPLGHVLVSSTPLAGSRWELHQVDIALMTMAARRSGDPISGDAAFDARFRVRQDGVPVRDAWLDEPTRAAVTTLFDVPGVTGPVWVQGQRLHVLRQEPWFDLDAASLIRALDAQAALAAALERTAGWRGPLA